MLLMNWKRVPLSGNFCFDNIKTSQRSDFVNTVVDRQYLKRSWSWNRSRSRPYRRKKSWGEYWQVFHVSLIHQMVLLIAVCLSGTKSCKLHISKKTMNITITPLQLECQSMCIMHLTKREQSLKRCNFYNCENCPCIYSNINVRGSWLCLLLYKRFNGYYLYMSVLKNGTFEWIFVLLKLNKISQD